MAGGSGRANEGIEQVSHRIEGGSCSVIERCVDIGSRVGSSRG